jgi:fucose 4-O-acetylase-like acetyltransferase
MGGESAVGPDHDAERGPTARARLDWVDALKGVGIVAVVAGHVWTRGWVRDAIYAVHMPLFFILSGYTARHVPWRIFLPAALRSLWVPFFCFSAILLAADFLIEGAKGFRPIFSGWWHGATTILFHAEQTRGPFTILWFIPCLFLARLAWNALTANGRRPNAPLLVVAMALVFALALFAHHFGQWSPLALLAVPGALLMIWAGALWRHWGPPPRIGAVAMAMIAVAVLIWFPPVNMKQGDIGWPGLSLAGAMAVTVTLAALLQRLPIALIGGLAMLGRATLVIMYAHVALIHYLRPYAPAAVIFVAALALSWELDRRLRRFASSRRILLGESKVGR